jgi:hypothetical protein
MKLIYFKYKLKFKNGYKKEVDLEWKKILKVKEITYQYYCYY